MKNGFRWTVIIIGFFCSIVLFGSTVAFAEDMKRENSAKAYMEQGIRAAYDNMHLIYQAYYDDEGNLETQPARYVAIWQEWGDEGNLISRTYLGLDGEPITTTGGFAKAEWKTDQYGIRKLRLFNNEGIQMEGVCILWNVEFSEDGWSEWMEPAVDSKNYCFTIGQAYLGRKTAGDEFTCSVEIEFKMLLQLKQRRFG